MSSFLTSYSSMRAWPWPWEKQKLHEIVNITTSGCFLWETAGLPHPCLFYFCGPFVKSSLNLLQYCFSFLFCFFGHKAYGILSCQTRDWTAPAALEGQVLTTGLQGPSREVPWSTSYTSLCRDPHMVCTQCILSNDFSCLSASKSYWAPSPAEPCKY